MTTSTFPLSDRINLSCRLGAGSLVVHAEDGCTEAVVELKPRDDDAEIVGRSVVELRGNTLVVETPERRGALLGGRKDRLDVEIVIPAGTAMQLEVASGDLTTTGRTGSVRAVTGSGEIRIPQVDGELDARTGSGGIEAGTVTGPAKLKVGSGDIIVAHTHGDLELSTGSGDLTLDVAGGAVRGKTGSGSVTIATADGDVDIRTGSGDIRIGLRRGRPAKLDAHTGSGDLKTEMPLEDAAPATGEPITIRARTGSGDVRVERSSAAPVTTG